MHVIGDVSNEIDQIHTLVESSQALDLLQWISLAGRRFAYRYSAVQNEGLYHLF